MHIEVVGADLRPSRQDLLSRAFALRHHVFVEDRGWTFLRRPDGLDIDTHDAGATTHFLALDGDSVIGHVRLVPGGYLAVARADPERIRDAAGDTKIAGLSRFCVAPEVRSPLKDAVITHLFTAALEHAIEQGTGALLFDTDPSIVFILRALGFSIKNVGEPAPIAGRMMQPIVLKLDASALSGILLKVAIWTRGVKNVLP